VDVIIKFINQRKMNFLKRWIFYFKAVWHEMFCRDYDCCRGYHTNNEEFDFEGHTIRVK